MNIFRKFLTVFWCGGREPSPGSPGARRIAMIEYAYRPVRKSFVALPVMTAALVLFGANQKWTLFLAIWLFNGVPDLGWAGSCTTPGAWFHLLPLPVDRIESYRIRFFFGFTFLAVIGVVIFAWLQCTGPFSALGNLHLGLLPVWVPLLIFSGCFSQIRINKFASCCILFGMLIGTIAAGLAVAKFAPVIPDAIPLILHVLLPGTMIGLLYHHGAKRFLSAEVSDAASPAFTSIPGPPTILAPVPMRSKSISTATDSTFRAVSSGANIRPGRIITAPMRRAALFRLAFDGATTRAKWFVAIWLCLLPIAPVIFQGLVHVLFTVLFIEYVVTRRWKWPGGVEFAHLLPIPRTELLLICTLPLLTLSFVMSALGFFFACVLKTPEAIWGLNSAIWGNYITTVVLLLGPVICTTITFDMVWPRIVRPLGSWIAVAIFIAPRFINIHLPWEKITPAGIAIAGLSYVFLGFGAAIAGCRHREIPSESVG